MLSNPFGAFDLLTTATIGRFGGGGFGGVGGDKTGKTECSKRCGRSSSKTECDWYQTCCTSCGKDGKSPCAACVDLRGGGSCKDYCPS
jgi:hypothetical protein